MRTKFYWWHRLQIEVGISFKLFPSGQMTWKQWLFDPVFGITYPGQEIKNRWQLPESTSYEVDVRSLQTEMPDKGPAKFASKVLWVHGAVRVLGLDIGAGLFVRPSPFLPHPVNER